MYEKEYSDFHKALLAWLNSQDVHPKIALPVLASVVAHKIGDLAKGRDAEHLCSVVSKTQELILTASMTMWLGIEPK